MTNPELSGVDLARLLHPDLATAGFTRERARWNRTADAFVDVVTLQTAKDGESATINVGVFDPVIHRLVVGQPEKPFVSEPDCLVRTRLGPLVGGSDGPWWPLVAASAEQIRVELVRVGLPWLDRLHSRQAILDELISKRARQRPLPIEVVQIAFLRTQLGDRTGACEELAELRQRVVGNAWRARLGEYASAMGCDDQSPGGDA